MNQQSKVLNSLFLLYIQAEDYRNIMKLKCKPLGFTSYKTFLKNKRKFGTNLSWANLSQPEIDLCFLIKLFSYMTKKIKYLKNDKMK